MTSTFSRWLTDHVRGLLALNVAMQVVIIVTGGLVRLTGSGLGCSTWPECVPGSYVPVPHQAEGYHRFIEFGNRTLTFVLVVVAVLAVLAIYRLRPVRPALRRWSWAPVAGIVVQAVLGGITVLVDLHPAVVALHFIISPLLVAATTVLYVRLGDGEGPARPAVAPPLRALARVTWGVALATMVLGTLVTGSGPHSGDADTPHRLPLDPRMISWLHADAALLLTGLAAGLLVGLWATRAPRAARRSAALLGAVIVLQAAVGYTQYFLGLPWGVVLLHMLGAGLLALASAAVLARCTAHEAGPESGPGAQNLRNGSAATRTNSTLR